MLLVKKSSKQMWTSKNSYICYLYSKKYLPMILPLVIAPDNLLKQKSTPVNTITSDTEILINDMFDTMYARNGIGLSAVQVGVMQRIIVVDVEQSTAEDGTKIKGKQYYMINPEIIGKSDDNSDFNEGCLSFPGENVNITRPAFITVKYLTLDGKTNEIQAHDLFATCIQHEIDHLNGITISSYVSYLKRELMMKRLLKRKKS